MCVKHKQKQKKHEIKQVNEKIRLTAATVLQALWKTLHNPDDSVAGVAYRVLGKFGGSNRKMISTPQPVSPVNKTTVTC